MTIKFLWFQGYRRLSLINGPIPDTQVLEAKPNVWHRVVEKPTLDGEICCTFPNLRDGEHGLRMSIILRDSGPEVSAEDKDRIDVSYSDTEPPPLTTARRPL